MIFSQKKIVFRLSSIILCGCLLASSCKNSGTLKEPNRLNDAASLYLREHADNPVDWYEWGDEALNRAKNEDKPLLISIGYASCHWCHQMESESFMDTAVAKLMNEYFVCIKVDREERPDIDNLYVHACQLLNNGQAGWPLNAFALPDGKPFFAGTYFNKESWKNLLISVADSYKNKRNKINMQANSLTFGIIDTDSLFLVPKDISDNTNNLYQSFFINAMNEIDLVNGGIKSTEKFPTPNLWQFFLQYYFFTHDRQSLDLALNTLDKMALSGLYDHIGGGFFRYTTDNLWQVPHFEKMLNDNAQLISLYAHAYRTTKNDFYLQTLLETVAFVENNLADKSGAFYSSISSISKDGEGEFYFWDKSSLTRGLDNGNLVLNYFKTIPAGQGQPNKGLIIPVSNPSDFAKRNGISTDRFGEMLSDAKLKLLNQRNQRNKPSIDNKIILSWNALMIEAYLDAYTASGKPVFLEKATTLSAFLERTLIKENGKLFRLVSNEKVSGSAFLEDYAYISKAFIRLYGLGFDKHWLEVAEKVVEYANANFKDKKSGLFYFSAYDTNNLAVKKIELVNNVMPASNAVMAEVLFSLGVVLEKQEYIDISKNMLNTVKGYMVTNSPASPEWGILAGMLHHPYFEVAIVGPEAVMKNLQLQSNYLAGCHFLGGNEENLALLEGKKQISGTWIYVCSQKLCKQPLEEVPIAFNKLIY